MSKQGETPNYIPDMLSVYDTLDDDDAFPGFMNTSPFESIDHRIDPRSGYLLTEKEAKRADTYRTTVEQEFDEIPTFFGITSAGYAVLLISSVLAMSAVFSLNPLSWIIGFTPITLFLILFFSATKQQSIDARLTIFIPTTQIEAKMFVPVQVILETKKKLYGKIVLEVSNGLFPVYLPSVSIFYAKPNEKVTRTFLFYAPARGKETIKKITLELNGIPGMFYVHKSVVPMQRIVVLPEPQRVQLPWSLKQKILDQFISEISVPQRGSGSDFLSLKDFEFGDEIRNIAWKATAKYNKLISKEFEEPRQLRFVIVLDSSLMMAGAKLEFVYSSAVELAKALRRTEHSTHILAIGHRELKKVSVGVSPAAIRRLGIELHRITPEGIEFSYDALFRSLMVNKLYDTVVIILTDVEKEPTQVKHGIVKIRPYVQRIFLFACNTPAFGTLWMQSALDENTYSVDEIAVRRNILEPMVRRKYLVRIRDMRKAVISAGAWFHLIDGYNTNILLELKKAMDLSGKTRRR